MDNWREGTRTGHTHEPNDVTVQLDGLGRQLSELPVEPNLPDPSDGPVFVDESGRRSKTYRRLGWVLAAICAAYAVTLVVALLGGNSTAPWLPLSGQEKQHSEDIEVRPAPSGDVVSRSPEATPTASSASGAAATPSSGASASASAAPGASAASAPESAQAPRDTESSAPAPGGSVTSPSAAGPSPSADVDPPTEESPPASPEPSESTVQPQEGTQ
ncbi:hypothetical protein ABZY45_00250 [Streptomyces sp. NPDC006516]|uniref:hypothetical protein n=1 Tax=Streptomyces sp. NPDC006516 TaxID=3154309 RepID=UPI00339E5C20